MPEEGQEDSHTTPRAGGSSALSMASLPAASSHEGFVQPSSYLRRSRGLSRPMTPARPETAVDRDQRIGLVG